MSIHSLGSFTAHATRMRTNHKDALGRMLTMARCALRLDQLDVAKGSGVTSKTISLVERGMVDANESTIIGLVRFYEAHGVQFFEAERAVSVPGSVAA